MLTLSIALIISGLLSFAGIFQWAFTRYHMSRNNNLLEYARQAGKIERQRIMLEMKKRQEEEREQAGRVFGLDFLIRHGSAFGGMSATCADGQSRKGTVSLDQIMMYGQQSSGKEYTYYIEDQGLVFCAGTSPDHLLLKSMDQPFEIREAGLGRDQGMMTDSAVIKKDVLYYVILESHHEISIRATAKC